MNTNIKQYDLAVIIGRFQPFHIGHKSLITEAFKIANNVLILVGSAEASLSTKNPWTYLERERMILSNFPVDDVPLVAPLLDYGTNAQWIEHVGSTVSNTRNLEGIGENIIVVGHDKDHSSNYLNFFPQWDFYEAPPFPRSGETINATKIRELYFNRNLHFTKSVLTENVWEIISKEEKPVLFKEWEEIEKYKKSWASSPYEPVFTTVDAVVVQSGHVLLIQRGGYPGYGLWALPGGFLDPKERLHESMIRELREETKLKVPPKVLQGSVKAKEVFDDPDRSQRGRTITHAFLIWLDDSEKLPKVKGSDDAIKARWFSFAEFETMRSEIYEDHFHIVQAMINKNITEEI